MNSQRRILLINPTITSRRSARFPFAILSLAASLEDHYAVDIIDGNVDRQFNFPSRLAGSRRVGVPPYAR